MNTTGRLNLRIAPHLWRALELLAKNEHRSMNNMIELLVIKQAEFMDIDIEGLKEKS